MNALRNKVQLIGRLGITPELKSFQDGKHMTRFPLATNESYKDLNGEWKQDTQWHSIIAWGKRAELIQRLAAKGDEIMIEGKLVANEYTDKDGVKRRNTEVVLQEVLVLERKEKAVKA